MRIVGGRYRSRVLAEFPGMDVRPTADRVKESLFNILGAGMQGARALDLFCGSGALGLECLSRGAREVVFNDRSPDSIRILRKNMQALGVREGAIVFTLDFAACLERVSGTFDFIFLDPPYRLDCGAQALQTIGERGLLGRSGTAVYERDRAFAGEMKGLEKYDERKYGKTFLTFFRPVGEVDP